MYEYRATVLHVVDGDTVHLDIDLGLDQHTLKTVRLLGVDAPENSTPAGKAASAYLGEQIDGATLTLKTVKDRREKYGRYLGTLYLDGSTDSVNDQLIAAGHAVPYSGGPR